MIISADLILELIRTQISLLSCWLPISMKTAFGANLSKLQCCREEDMGPFQTQLHLIEPITINLFNCPQHDSCLGLWIFRHHLSRETALFVLKKYVFAGKDIHLRHVHQLMCSFHPDRSNPCVHHITSCPNL